MNRRLQYISVFCLLMVLVSVFIARGQEADNIIFLPHSELVTQVEWSPDGSKLAMMSWSQIRIFDTDAWEQISTIINPFVYDISWSPNSRFIAGVRGGNIESVLIWDANTGMFVQEWEKQLPSDESGIIILHTIAWHPIDPYIATDTIESPNAALIWDTSAQNNLPFIQEFKVEDNITHSSFDLSWNESGTLLLSSGVDDNYQRVLDSIHVPTTRIFDVVSGETIARLDGNRAVWGQNDNTIANSITIDSVYRIAIWNLSSESTILHFDEHTNTVVSMAWNTHENVIASADVNDNLFIWNPETGVSYDVEPINLSNIRSLAWKPDSNILAIAGQEGVFIKIYSFLALL